MLSTKAAPTLGFRKSRALLSSIIRVSSPAVTTINGISILFVFSQRSKQLFQSAHPVLATLLSELRVNKQRGRSRVLEKYGANRSTQQPLSWRQNQSCWCCNHIRRGCPQCRVELRDFPRPRPGAPAQWWFHGLFFSCDR